MLRKWPASPRLVWARRRWWPEDPSPHCSKCLTRSLVFCNNSMLGGRHERGEYNFEAVADSFPGDWFQRFQCWRPLWWCGVLGPGPPQFETLLTKEVLNCFKVSKGLPPPASLCLHTAV